MATGDSSGGIYTISGLSAATEYTVEVAAVNSAGVRVYSDPIAVMTDGEQPCLSVCLLPLIRCSDRFSATLGVFFCFFFL